MLLWLFKISFFSFILIFLIHHLFNYFKDNLTIPKTRDLVNKPLEKYKEMYEIINSKQTDTEGNKTTNISSEYLPNGNVIGNGNTTTNTVNPQKEELQNTMPKYEDVMNNNNIHSIQTINNSETNNEQQNILQQNPPTNNTTNTLNTVNSGANVTSQVDPNNSMKNDLTDYLIDIGKNKETNDFFPQDMTNNNFSNQNFLNIQ